jgi:carbon monoxide dehydrogenase subunit G
MEVKLDKRYPVAATTAQSWAVLSDIHATAACMPGAQITERVDDTHYRGTVKSKVGPAVMFFQGEVELLGRDADKRELRLLAKGADRSGSSAAMDLAAHVEPDESGGGSVLVGRAVVTVSGKLAQFGNRLLLPVSDAMLSQFADNFRAAASAVPAAGEGPGGAEAGEPTAPVGAAGIEGVSPSASRSSEAPPPRSAPPVKELRPLALLWIVIRNWFAGLFGKKS